MLKTQVRRLQHQVTLTFRQLFPKIKEITDPRERTERELRMLVKSSQNMHYLHLLGRVGVILHRYSEITVESIAYKNHQLIFANIASNSKSTKSIRSVVACDEPSTITR